MANGDGSDTLTRSGYITVTEPGGATTAQDVTVDILDDNEPPVMSVGALGWIRANLFNGWLNSLLTILTLIFLWRTVPPLLRWMFIDSVWFTSGAQCREVDGACWSVVTVSVSVKV